MVSYRTLIFGTIAVISASAPALANGTQAIPGPQQSIVAPTGPNANGTGALPVRVKPQSENRSNAPGIMTIILQSIGHLEQQILQLHR